MERTNELSEKIGYFSLKSRSSLEDDTNYCACGNELREYFVGDEVCDTETLMGICRECR